jgi:putative tricarboxylic transport membrane protein
MYVGNLLLLAMSIPLIGLFVRVLTVRPAILAAVIALITMLGVYSLRNSIFDMQLVIALGALGYLMKKSGLEPGPLVLAFVLGGLLETSFRQSMLIFDGDPTGFAGRPISGSLLAALVLFAVVLPAASAIRRTRSHT